MFEKDLPGGNTTGFGGASVSHLPLETCETINNSWGFNITDTTYKTTKQLVDYLVRAAGFGANFLLNIGPMPNGEIQPEFKDRLADMGNWLRTYGKTVYNTKAGYLHPQAWGCITQNNDTMFVHVLDKTSTSVTLENFPYSAITKAYMFKDHSPVSAQLRNGTVTVQLKEIHTNEPDEVIVMIVKQ